MRLNIVYATLTTAAIALGGCSPAEPPQQTEAADAAANEPAMPPFKPVATNAVLMRGTIEYAAYDYWTSVSIVVDAEGEHQYQPETAEEWERVWAAGITLAESGNLLMMPPRALDQGEWMRLSQALVDAGLEAARAADEQDFMGVMDQGENIYNVCSECHEKYVPSIRI